jgi:hypothetical protein
LFVSHQPATFLHHNSPMAPKAPKAKAEPKAKGTQRMLSFTSVSTPVRMS